MDASYVFPQGVLATIILVGGGAGDGRDRAGLSCEVEIVLCSVAVTAISSVGSDPKLLEQES